MELKSKKELFVRIFINILLTIFDINICIVIIGLSIKMINEGVNDYWYILPIIVIPLSWAIYLQIKETKKYIHQYNNGEYKREE